MTTTHFAFEGLDTIAITLGDAAVAAREVGYIVLRRVDSPQAMPQIGKRMWSFLELASYIDGADESEDDLAPLSETGSGLGSVWDEPGSNADAPSAPNGTLTEQQHRILAAAAQRWMEHIAKGNMGPDADEVTFKVELRSPKGMACIAAPRFRCRRLGAAPGGTASNIDPTIDVRNLPVPAPPRVGAVIDPGASAWQALNVAHESLVAVQMRTVGLLQASYTHLHRMAASMLNDVRDVANITTRGLVEQVKRLNAENAAKDKLIIQLSTELLEFRIDLASLGIDKQTSAETEKKRLDLAEKALGQVGKLGEMYLAGQLDMPPQLADLLSMVREDKELMEVLCDPKLPIGLKNPTIRGLTLDALKSVISAVPDAPVGGESSPNAGEGSSHA